jgi:DNA invertase Pin-like site-specific DNA recombinase
MNKLIFAYCRVSTLAQVTDSQRLALREYLDAKGIVCEVIEDKATGANQKRAGFQKLYGEIKAGHVATVYVYDLTRIGRNLRENLEFAQACLDRKVELLTPAGRLQFNMLSSFAEYLREDIVERTKAGIAARKAKGLLHGGTAPGWASKKVIKLLPRLKELHELGFSIRHIKKVLGMNERTIRKYIAKLDEKPRTRREVNTAVYGKSEAKS